MKTMVTQTSTEPVQPGNFTGVQPEFGRTADVQRLFGLRRGSLYNLFGDGKIKGVLLRVRGQKSGVRLWHLQSIADCIRSQMAHQKCDSERAAAGEFSKPPSGAAKQCAEARHAKEKTE